MLKFIVRRMVSYVAMLFVATSITYFLASMFLDPRSNYLALRPQPPEESIDRSLDYANVNPDTPLLERYGTWLKGLVLHLDFGRSPQGEPINDQLWHRALISLELVTLATLLAIVIGIAVGVASAIRKYSLYDRTTNAISVFFLVTPRFVLALLVALLYLNFQEATGLNPLYVTGPIQGGFLEYLRYIALPTVTLTLAGYVTYHLTQRTYLLDTINDDYVRTARAKGLRKNVAIRRHALRTSLIPTTMSVALSLALMVTGAVFVEQIYAINGAGLYFIDTLSQNDINGAVGVAFLGGVATCVGLLLADIATAMLDPRIRIS